MTDDKTRTLLSKQKTWREFELEDEGLLRRSGRYVAWWYEEHAVQHTEEAALQAIPKNITQPHHGGGEKHLRKLMHCVQSAANDERVAFFMVGKASAPRDRHAHAGMVARFGDKYKQAGYALMVALWMIDGATDALAEHRILRAESTLHAIYANHGKFDVALSNAQSGSLSKKPATSLFTLYLAICFENSQGDCKKIKNATYSER